MLAGAIFLSLNVAPTEEMKEALAGADAVWHLAARPGVRDAWQWKGDGACVTKPDSGRCLDFIYVGNVLQGDLGRSDQVADAHEPIRVRHEQRD